MGTRGSYIASVRGLVFFFLVHAVAAAQAPATVTESGAAIDSVLAEVQNGLAVAQTEIEKLRMPPLESVTLTLQTEYNSKAGPKLKLFVLSFGATWERQRSNELVLKLVPPNPGKSVQMSKTEGLSDQLVEALVSVAVGVKDASNRKPPLNLESLKAEFGFVVKTSVNGAAKFEILPVGVELGGDFSKKAVHKIAVSFASPKTAGK
jgi:hypothetical protein